VVFESDGVSLTLAWCGKTRHGGGSSSRGPFDKTNSVMTMMSWEYARQTGE
jgi:hypothetical protein